MVVVVVVVAAAAAAVVAAVVVVVVDIINGFRQDNPTLPRVLVTSVVSVNPC